MCIDAGKPYKGSKKKVFVVWKACSIKDGKLHAMCGWYTPDNEPVILPIGKYTKARLYSTKKDFGWHACGDRDSAYNAWYPDAIVRCKVRGVISRNKWGDVRSEWMYISKRDAAKALKEAKR